MGCLTTLLPDTRSHDNEPLNPVPEDHSALLLSTSELNNPLKIYNTTPLHNSDGPYKTLFPIQQEREAQRTSQNRINIFTNKLLAIYLRITWTP